MVLHDATISISPLGPLHVQSYDSLQTTLLSYSTSTSSPPTSPPSSSPPRRPAQPHFLPCPCFLSFSLLPSVTFERDTILPSTAFSICMCGYNLKVTFPFFASSHSSKTRLFVRWEAQRRVHQGCMEWEERWEASRPRFQTSHRYFLVALHAWLALKKDVIVHPKKRGNNSTYRKSDQANLGTDIQPLGAVARYRALKQFGRVQH